MKVLLSLVELDFPYTGIESVDEDEKDDATGETSINEDEET